MPNTSLRNAPRRSSPKRRGVLWGAVLGASALLGAALLAVSGRGLPRLSLFPGEAKIPPRNPELEAKRNRSLSKALGQIDAKTIAAYLERWSQGASSAAPSQRRAVWVDTEILARRHPAWRLAGELERGTVSPSDPRIARNLASIRGQGTDFSAPMARGVDAAPRAVPGLLVAEKGAGASLWAGPNRALDPFLRQNAARDARRARDDAFLARRSLDDATDLARRRAVAELELPVLSPETALELLNLRLQLLRNLSRTPAERAATREEIRSIEARYAALLAQQTREQAARLRAITVELPDQARRAGVSRLQREAQATAQKQAQTRRALALESQNRWRRDSASLGPLSLALPPLRRVSSPSIGARRDSDSRAARPANDFFETAPWQAPSNPSLESKTGVSSANRRALAAQLREQARADARIWARAGATRMGAARSQSSQAPDATAQVLQIVFPGSAP